MITKLLSYDNKVIIMSILCYTFYYCKAFLLYRKKSQNSTQGAIFFILNNRPMFKAIIIETKLMRITKEDYQVAWREV